VRNVTFLEMYAIGAGEVVGIIALLEKTLATTKPGYKEYVESTSAFIPWFPRKKRRVP
jgi:steroid 5-alpha reductase family enzyme